MIRCRSLADSRGVTLVELVIVMLMMGIVTIAIYGVYQSTQRSSTTQDQTVELQQNLRIAMDSITRDIQLAGFLIPASQDAITVADATTLTMQTATTNGKTARVATAFTSPTDATTTSNIAVLSSDEVDFFTASSDPADADWVRIVRPSSRTQPLNDTFQVYGKDRTAKQLTLYNFDTAAGVSFSPGDVIVRVPSKTSTLPRTVTYSLSGTDLTRNDGISTDTVASSISAVQYSYLLDDNTELTPPGSTVSASDMANIRAIRVTLSAQTQVLSVEGQVENKTRQLTSVIALRNR